MPDGPSNGIPHPTATDRWVVPPWAPDAGVCEVVDHFLRFRPSPEESTGHWLAYYTGYRAALAAARTDGLTYAFQRHWYEDVLHNAERCVEVYRERAAVETTARGREYREKVS